MAKEAFPQDKLIYEVDEGLRLSHKGITTDPRQVVPQLLQRLQQTQVSVTQLHNFVNRFSYTVASTCQKSSMNKPRIFAKSLKLRGKISKPAN